MWKGECKRLPATTFMHFSYFYTAYSVYLQPSCMLPLFPSQAYLIVSLFTLQYLSCLYHKQSTSLSPFPFSLGHGLMKQLHYLFILWPTKYFSWLLS
jgi:hypothetical protein